MERWKKGYSLPGWKEGAWFRTVEELMGAGSSLPGRSDARFWEYLLAIDTAPEDIWPESEAPAAQFDYKGGQQALPILLSLRRWRIPPAPASQDDSVRDLRTLAEYILLGERPGCMLSWRRDTLTIVLYGPDFPSEEELHSLCEELGKITLDRFKCEIACYLGEADTAEGAAGQVDLLRKGDMDNVTDTCAIRTLAQLRRRREQLTPPVLRDWMPYFVDGKSEEFCRCIEDYFKQAVAANNMNRAFLAHFQQDFMQEVGFALKNSGVELHRLFSEMDELMRMESAIRYLPDMVEWVRYTAEKAIRLMRPEDEGKPLSQRVCDYVSHRLVYPFRREEIAQAFHLSEGHIARVFRAEMGMTITEYLTSERIKLACLKIQQTNLPLTQIAEQCGFHDYPYFYKTFRKRMGKSPTDYQQEMQDLDK